MNTISKFGLAAVLALGVSGAAMAQDADVGLDAGADVEIGADTGLGDVNTDLGVDAMATGSIASGCRPVRVIREREIYTPSVIVSPWAKLAKRRMLKVSETPMAPSA